MSNSLFPIKFQHLLVNTLFFVVFFYFCFHSCTIETDKHLPPTLTVPTLQQLLGANRFAKLQYAYPITGSTLAINFQLKITIMPITCTQNHIISMLCHYTIIVITPRYMDCFARRVCTQRTFSFSFTYKLPISFPTKSIEKKNVDS